MSKEKEQIEFRTLEDFLAFYVDWCQGEDELGELVYQAGSQKYSHEGAVELVSGWSETAELKGVHIDDPRDGVSDGEYEEFVKLGGGVFLTLCVPLTGVADGWVSFGVTGEHENCSYLELYGWEHFVVEARDAMEALSLKRRANIVSSCRDRREVDVQARARYESGVPAQWDPMPTAYDVSNVLVSPEDKGLMMTALLDVAHGMDLPVHAGSEGGRLLALYADAVGINEDEWTAMIREWGERTAPGLKSSISGWNDAWKEWLSTTIWGFVRDAGPAFAEGGRRTVADHPCATDFMCSRLWQSETDTPSNSFGVCRKAKGIEDGLFTLDGFWYQRAKYPFMPAAVSDWGAWSADPFERLNGHGALIMWALHESSGRRLEVRLDHPERRNIWHYSIGVDNEDDAMHRKDHGWQGRGTVLSWLIGLRSRMFHFLRHELDGRLQPHVAGEDTPFGRLMGGSFELCDRNPELTMIGNVARIEFDGLDSDEGDVRDVLLYSSSYHLPPCIIKMVLSGFGKRAPEEPDGDTISEKSRQEGGRGGKPMLGRGLGALLQAQREKEQGKG